MTHRFLYQLQRSLDYEPICIGMGQRNAGTFTVEMEQHISEDMLGQLLIQRLKERALKVASENAFKEQVEKFKRHYTPKEREQKKKVWELWNRFEE